MRPFPPTLKDRARHISFRLVSEKPLQERDAALAIQRHMLQVMGELGAAKSRLHLVSYDGESCKGMMRVTNDTLWEALAALSLMGGVAGTRAKIEIINVSGTMRKAGRDG